jgi:hypothetical protein
MKCTWFNKYLKRVFVHAKLVELPWHIDLFVYMDIEKQSEISIRKSKILFSLDFNESKLFWSTGWNFHVENVVFFWSTTSMLWWIYFEIIFIFSEYQSWCDVDMMHMLMSDMMVEMRKMLRIARMNHVEKRIHSFWFNPPNIESKCIACKINAS